MGCLRGGKLPLQIVPVDRFVKPNTKRTLAGDLTHEDIEKSQCVAVIGRTMDDIGNRYGSSLLTNVLHQLYFALHHVNVRVLPMLRCTVSRDSHNILLMSRFGVCPAVLLQSQLTSGNSAMPI